MRYILAMVCCMMISPAYAIITGNELYEWCNSEVGSTKVIACLSYVSGVVDSFTVINANYPKSPIRNTICLPSGAEMQQAVEVTRRYLDNNPQDRHKNAAIHVLISVGKAWPCK